MRHTLFFSILICACSTTLQAQEELDYTIHLREGASWTEGTYSSFQELEADENNPFIQELAHFEIKGDSVIESKRYHKISCNGNLIGLIHNQNGDIYCRILQNAPVPKRMSCITEASEQDFLLYSFSGLWNIGDSCQYARECAEEYKEEIKEPLLNTFRLANGKYYKQYRNIVYGLGNITDGPLGQLVPQTDDGVSWCLFNFYKDNELLYEDKTIGLEGLYNTHDKEIQIIYSSQEKVLKILPTLTDKDYKTEIINPKGDSTLSFSGNSFHLGGLKQGIYIVRISVEGKVVTHSKIRVE